MIQIYICRTVCLPCCTSLQFLYFVAMHTHTHTHTHKHTHGNITKVKKRLLTDWSCGYLRHLQHFRSYRLLVSRSTEHKKTGFHFDCVSRSPPLMVERRAFVLYKRLCLSVSVRCRGWNLPPLLLNAENIQIQPWFGLEPLCSSSFVPCSNFYVTWSWSDDWSF